MMDILAFNDYVEEKYGNFTEVALQVSIKDKGIDKRVPVTFLSDYSGISLGIMWESVGFDNYEEMGLFGLYYTTSENMTYDSNKNTLRVIDSNGMELIIEA